MFNYTQTIQKLIIRLKYGLVKNKLKIIDLLIDYWFKHNLNPLISKWSLSSSVLIPIPSHNFRLSWRGFDLPQVISRSVSRLTKIPTKHLLVRQTATKPRIGLNHQIRQKSVIGVFKSRTVGLRAVKNIILVDDVVVTGSTLKSASWSLLSSYPDSRFWFIAFTRRF